MAHHKLTQHRYDLSVRNILGTTFGIHRYRGGLAVANEQHDCRIGLTGYYRDRSSGFILSKTNGNRGSYQPGCSLGQFLFKGKMRCQREVGHDGNTVFTGFLYEWEQCLPDTDVFPPVIGPGLGQFLCERFQ